MNPAILTTLDNGGSFHYAAVSGGDVTSASPSLTNKGWEAECTSQSEAYYASDEYKQSVIEREAERVKAQDEVNRLLIELPKAFESKKAESVLDWLAQFTPLADNGGVYFSIPGLANDLKGAGYVSGAWSSKENGPQMAAARAAIAASKQAEAEYIIGQAISCLDAGMPPHSVLNTFVDRYYGKKNDVEDDAEVENAVGVYGFRDGQTGGV